MDIDNSTKELKRKVRINMILVSRLYMNFKEIQDISNRDMLEFVKNQISSHFGERPIKISDESILTLIGHRYPEFYAAGWFISDDPITNTDGKGSELVIVAHGDSMKAAQKAMMLGVEMASWDSVAKNIWDS
jgi:hypothetical protein